MVAEKKCCYKNILTTSSNLSVRIAAITFKSSCQENTKKKKKNPNPLNSKIDTSLQVISQNPDHIHPNNLFIHSD